ncbi:hypothetical protein E1B28_012925 [Marasmius oreades]|uniref:Uncharacterized protein n=1 Tax=Marasmius oreades TaxID=181124 RepID=A0A9P7RSL4_9AGAR|nr:uncharacterized protein E1B28_012925 [Marasmius oreades]KAG7088979.1 hypothetical protein E1B28_012925 [Marasmius oreades]
MRSIIINTSLLPDTVKPFLVAYFSGDAAQRQLSEFDDDKGKQNLIKLIIEQLNGALNGDWYKLPSDGAVEDARKRTRDLGGVVYDLPVRKN